MSSALIVSASQKGIDRLVEWLGNGYACTGVGSVAGARVQMDARRFDLLVINAPLADGDGEELPRPRETDVLLLTPQASYEAVCARMVPRGVVVLAKPLSPVLFQQAVSLLQATRSKLSRMEEKLTEVRIVERAKGLLMLTLSMTEAQAHRYIEKQAMDLRLTKREIAESILRTYEY